MMLPQSKLLQNMKIHFKLKLRNFSKNFNTQNPDFINN